MNREQKLKYIKENHPKLFESLNENIQNLETNIYNLSLDEINSYNRFVAFYCGTLFNVELMNRLLI